MSDGFGLLRAGDVVDEFEVIELLAEGGMGAVFVARQKSTGRRRALKVLHPRVVLDAKLRERFLAEATIAGEIGGAHPVDVVACGIDPARNIPWIAMELLEGETLELRVRRAPLAHAECAALFRELGDVLDRAHRKGIVHRDLKPENVFLMHVPTNDRGFVTKVLDFGIAAFLNEGRTAATATRAMGTPLWMAPEQYETRGKIRPATDVWSLGLIAFFALTGREFWLAAHEENASMAALIAEVLSSPIPSASERLRELEVTYARGAALREIPETRAQSALPEGFDAWFARCVARAPAERFATGAEACTALLSLLAERSPGRSVLQKTIPSTPEPDRSKRDDGAVKIQKTEPVIVRPPPDLERSEKSPTKPDESNAPLIGAFAFIAISGVAVVAYKSMGTPAPAPAASASAAPSIVSAPSPVAAARAALRANQPDRVHVAHVLIAHVGAARRSATVFRDATQARAQADLVRQRARNGEDFGDLARRYSDDGGNHSRGGDLGYIVRGQTVQPFEDAAFALSVGQISEVVSTEFGFHVIKRID